jgi:hypothetical protein
MLMVQSSMLGGRADLTPSARRARPRRGLGGAAQQPLGEVVGATTRFGLQISLIRMIGQSFGTPEEFLNPTSRAERCFR